MAIKPRTFWVLEIIKVKSAKRPNIWVLGVITTHDPDVIATHIPGLITTLCSLISL